MRKRISASEVRGRVRHAAAVRWRAFAIWQKLGYYPWRKAGAIRKGRQRDGAFYKGAFDDIPFLNDDAKRTFVHLLLRPGYMIRDYGSGQHERYLAPLTALIIFYAFFALISAVLQPYQQKASNPFSEVATSVERVDSAMNETQPEVNDRILFNTIKLLSRGYVLLHLDLFPKEVDTQREASLAALEGKLRSQGIPIFLDKFFVLWLAMWLALRRQKKSLSACASGTAYVLCQFSFFMLFAVLLTLGKKTSIGILLILTLLTIDYHQWLDLSWKKSFRRALSTGIWYGLVYAVAIIVISLGAVTIAYLRT